jgi:hypothetical protein
MEARKATIDFLKAEKLLEAYIDTAKWYLYNSCMPIRKINFILQNDSFL